VPYSPTALTALVVATSFAAGLNVYATVATLGILARAHFVVLPPSIGLVNTWPVIGASLALYLVEFVADKIPAIDLVWNALQTFVRVPIAALLAYTATNQLTPTEQLIASVLGAVVALAAHGGKSAARVAVTPSPEPFSNIALSLGEDVIAVFVTWLATQHPFWAAAIVAGLVAILIAVIRSVVRGVRALFRGASRQLHNETPPSM
jgi:hypothetical protein